MSISLSLIVDILLEDKSAKVILFEIKIGASTIAKVESIFFIFESIDLISLIFSNIDHQLCY